MDIDPPTLQSAGELVKAVPPGVFQKVTDTACETFRELIAPITARTAGAGRLIAARYDSQVEWEKANTATAIEYARQRIAESGKTVTGQASPKVVIAAIEGAAREEDADLQRLWGNLLASEVTGGGVHPAFPRILSQLTPEDAQTLARIEGTGLGDRVMRAVRASLRTTGSQIGIPGWVYRKESMSYSLLESLGLIAGGPGDWDLTGLGRAFIQAVSGPAPAQQSGEQPATTRRTPA